MALRDQSVSKARSRRPTKAELAKRQAAYQLGVHDGQMAAFTMMAFVAHPELLEELLEGRATALTRALRAIGGHPDESADDGA